MADLFAQIGQMANVRASLEKAVIKHPTDPQAYVFLGGFAKNDGRVTEADLLFGKASELLRTSRIRSGSRRCEPRTLGRAGLGGRGAFATGRWRRRIWKRC